MITCLALMVCELCRVLVFLFVVLVLVGYLNRLNRMMNIP
jgi:hypothetical protein